MTPTPSRRITPAVGASVAHIAASVTAVTAAAVGTLVLAAAPAYAAPDPSPGPPAYSGPHPSPQLPGAVGAKLNLLLGMGMAVVIFACVAGVLACAGKLALALRHGEGAEAAGKLAAVGFACILVGSAAGIVGYLS